MTYGKRSQKRFDLNTKGEWCINKRLTLKEVDIKYLKTNKLGAMVCSIAKLESPPKSYISSPPKISVSVEPVTHPSNSSAPPISTTKFATCVQSSMSTIYIFSSCESVMIGAMCGGLDH